MKKTITLILFFTTTILFSQVPNYVPTNGLGCYYSFVGNANDLYNSLNGIPNGGSYTNDAYGSQNSAYSFNGTTDFIDIPFDFFNGSTQNETSIRIKFKYNSQGNMTLWNKDGDWKELAINILSNKSIQFFGAYSNYYLDIKTIPNTIIENIWYDVVVIIANNSAKIYINGIEQLTYSINNINNSTISFSSQGSCATNLGINRFGKAKTSCANAQYLNGVIDEFGIWNRALTQQEITNLYNASQPQNICLPSYVPINGLVGYWPFCGNANDESGNGNNGVVNGATLTADRFGSSNSAYNFDGISQFIEVPSTLSLSVSNFYTISAWISADIWSFNSPIDEHAIVSKIENGNWYGGYEVFSGGNGIIYHTGNIGSNFSVSSGGYLQNNWYFITATYNGVNINLYVNGILVDSMSRTGTIQTSNIPLRFGRRGGAGNYNNWFDGKIDDIAIWNRALTQQEITNLYNASLSTEDFAINTIDIYPNPTTSLLNFKSAIQVDKILIYNMLGQLVQEEKVNALEGTINIENLAQGTYIVKVNDIAKGYTVIKN